MIFSSDDYVEYKKYLNSITLVLKKYFENQKEYICCKKGCSFCCEYGIYPFSQLEFEFMILGFMSLNENEKYNILMRINNLKIEYYNSDKAQKFTHRCPFLNENKECSIYDYRGIICRSFGLITQLKDGRIRIPFCCDLGLNYSKIYDSKLEKIDYNKVKKYNYTIEPAAYRVSLATLMSSEIFKDDPIKFGETKPLIEWL